MTDIVIALATRVAVAGGVITTLVAGRQGLVAWQATRRKRALNAAPLPQFAGVAPTVLLFTGTLCGDCMRQKETLAEIHQVAGGWRLRELQAAHEPGLTRRFGVASVPATVILDPSGRPAAINYGFVEPEVLRGQLEAVQTSRD